MFIKKDQLVSHSGVLHSTPHPGLLGRVSAGVAAAAGSLLCTSTPDKVTLWPSAGTWPLVSKGDTTSTLCTELAAVMVSWAPDEPTSASAGFHSSTLSSLDLAPVLHGMGSHF